MVPPPPDPVALAVADEVRSQVAAVSVIAVGILATKGEFISPQAIHRSARNCRPCPQQAPSTMTSRRSK